MAEAFQDGGARAGLRGPLAGPIAEVPVELSVCVGRARVAIRELMALAPGSVLGLDHRVEDPVELRVGERLVAYGELVEGEGDLAGMLAVRVTALAAPDAAA